MKLYLDNLLTLDQKYLVRRNYLIPMYIWISICTVVSVFDK